MLTLWYLQKKSLPHLDVDNQAFKFRATAEIRGLLQNRHALFHTAYPELSGELMLILSREGVGSILPPQPQGPHLLLLEELGKGPTHSHSADQG